MRGIFLQINLNLIHKCTEIFTIQQTHRRGQEFCWCGGNPNFRRGEAFTWLFPTKTNIFTDWDRPWSPDHARQPTPLRASAALLCVCSEQTLYQSTWKLHVIQLSVYIYSLFLIIWCKENICSHQLRPIFYACATNENGKILKAAMRHAASSFSDNVFGTNCFLYWVILFIKK